MQAIALWLVQKFLAIVESWIDAGGDGWWRIGQTHSTAAGSVNFPFLGNISLQLPVMALKPEIIVGQWF